MAFNRSLFNHLPFNVKAELARYLRVSGLEEVDASVGSALNYYALAIGNERVNETLEAEKARFITASGLEEISEAVGEAQMTVILFPHFSEEVTEQINLGADIMPVVNGSEAVNASVALGANYYAVINGNETVDADIAIGANFYAMAEGYELISESASLENIETKTCVLTLTLKPGQTLIVDANNYNVLLDSQNAINVQSGDWIDELNRNTTDITIRAASGSANLSATILYTERYL